GQGNYAAANAFLCALAAARRASGFAAGVLAGGVLAEASRLSRGGGAGGRARIGSGAWSAREGLALLDAALGRDEAVLVPSRVDVAGLRAAAARGGPQAGPALLRGLVPPGGPAPPRAGGAGGGGAGAVWAALGPPPRAARPPGLGGPVLR